MTSRSITIEQIEELVAYFDRTYPSWFDHLIEAFSTIDYNTKKNNLDYLAAIVVNLTQSKIIRHRLRDKQYLKRLLCFTDRHHSAIRRGSIACILKNCCFDHGLFNVRALPMMRASSFLCSESHEDLIHRLGDNDDFVCALLLPLAGSTTDELTDEENDRLPIDLQYLPSDKQREPDRDIQQILLETLLLVCDRHRRTNMTSMDLSTFSSVQRSRSENTFVRNRSI